jgi:hypothetical protein
MKEVVEQVISAYGGVKAVQNRFGYKEPMAVYNWRFRGIPKTLLAEIHVDTGIEIQRLQQGTEVKPPRAA